LTLEAFGNKFFKSFFPSIKLNNVGPQSNRVK
jgi:hypothetical protein